MDPFTRPSTPTGFDRLTALREPASSQAHQQRYKFRLDVLIGVVCIVAGMALVLGFVIFQSSEAPVQENGTTVDVTTPSNDESTLLVGEAFLALAVDHGRFPPEVVVGDLIKVVVTPGVDGSGESKLIPEDLLVTQVSTSSDMVSQTIFTVRAPQSLLPVIASSGPLHIARVQVGAP